MSNSSNTKILTFKSLIDYQEGAIVSKQIIKTETGNITLFAFDQGQELSEHTAAYDALVHILDGEAEIIISGEKHKVRVGDGIVMPANEPHAVKATHKFLMLLTMIKP